MKKKVYSQPDIVAIELSGQLMVGEASQPVMLYRGAPIVDDDDDDPNGARRGRGWFDDE